jgi:integrase
MLTDIQVKGARAQLRPYKLYDQHGLYAIIQPNGGKWWRFRYRLHSKEKTLSLGTYPEVSLKVAREKRDAFRNALKQGQDPSQRKHQTSASDTFQQVALEWFEKYRPIWAEGHSKKLLGRLESHVFPWIGGRPIGMITTADILPILRRIEARGTYETARRVKTICSQVMRYAIGTARRDSDPTVHLLGALTPVRARHYSAITDPEVLHNLVRQMRTYNGSIVVRTALLLAAMLFVRPGELRKARWADIDFKDAEWRFTISKTDTPHIVPLATHTLKLLRELEPITRHSTYVFPGAQDPDRPMSENAVITALRRLGVTKEEMTGHGFRAAARTILDEVLGFRPDFIEHQLGHKVRGPLGRAYNRTTHLTERREMMQAWADFLMEVPIAVAPRVLRSAA